MERHRHDQVGWQWRALRVPVRFQVAPQGLGQAGSPAVLEMMDRFAQGPFEQHGGSDAVNFERGMAALGAKRRVALRTPAVRAHRVAHRLHLGLAGRAPQAPGLAASAAARRKDRIEQGVAEFAPPRLPRRGPCPADESVHIHPRVGETG